MYGLGTYVLGPHADGGRAKKRDELEGLGLGMPLPMLVKMTGRVVLLLPVTKVTERAVAGGAAVGTGRCGCGSRARRPGARRVTRSMVDSLLLFLYVSLVSIGWK